MRYLALLDILGFSQFVESVGLDTVVQSYAPLVTSTHLSAEMIDDGLPPLEYQVHSDTICIITKDDSASSLIALVRFCHYALVSYFHGLTEESEGRVPIRGAIAKSDLIFGEHLFTTQAFGRPAISSKSIPTLLGKAVVQANRWEKKQEWIGISLCPELYSEVTQNSESVFGLLQQKLLVQYEIPTKGNGNVTSLAVNPIETFQLTHIRETLRKRCENGRMHAKQANTSRFIEHLYSKALTYP